MRVIDAGLTLASKLERKVRVHWKPNQDLYSPFCSLFEPLAGVEIVEGMQLASRLAFRFGEYHKLMRLVGNITDTAYYYWNENERLERDAELLEPLKRFRHIHIISYWRFMKSLRPFKAFTPVPELSDRIDAICDSFDEHVIGVHIRRTDNIKAISNSPIELFEKAMAEQIQRNDRTHFYLATDSTEIKKFLLRRFPDRITTSKSSSSRTDISGMQDAVVELYCLSRTSCLFGSFFSSFSRTAAELGGIEEVTIRR